MTCPRITRYTGAVKQELQGDEINFSAFAGAPADGPVPRALLPSGAVAEGDRPGARRHALPDDPPASGAALPRPRPLPALGREHPQDGGPLPEHAGRDHGGQVPTARERVRAPRAASPVAP